MCSNEQLLSLKVAPFRLCNQWGKLFSRLDAAVIPPYMEVNIQQGIIDTSQVHGSTTSVARWGDVLTNLDQKQHNCYRDGYRQGLQVQMSGLSVWARKKCYKKKCINVYKKCMKCRCHHSWPPVFGQHLETRIQRMSAQNRTPNLTIKKMSQHFHANNANWGLNSVFLPYLPAVIFFHFVLFHLVLLTLMWINHCSDTGWSKFDYFLFPAPLGPLRNACMCVFVYAHTGLCNSSQSVEFLNVSRPYFCGQPNRMQSYNLDKTKQKAQQRRTSGSGQSHTFGNTSHKICFSSLAVLTHACMFIQKM